jgi:hypothetical protein
MQSYLPKQYISQVFIISHLQSLLHLNNFLKNLTITTIALIQE